MKIFVLILDVAYVVFFGYWSIKLWMSNFKMISKLNENTEKVEHGRSIASRAGRQRI